jgi:inosine/xanthosine triphosphate pyrophosphatase family protein
LPQGEKNLLSHRARAIEAMGADIEGVRQWLAT